jgi:PRTRC genetic system protein B
MIDTYVYTGDDVRYQLQQAVLLYRDGRRNAFVTLHNVLHTENAPPQIGPGRSLTHAFLRDISKQLKSEIPIEILPEHVLCRTDSLIVWYEPARPRTMFYTDQDTGLDYSLLSGKTFPQPALVWKISGHSISVRALRTNKRPTADTPLYIAPYWNVYETGVICGGTMRRPSTTTVLNLHEWSDAFFGSYFTHPNASKRYTTHPGGFFALWHETIGKKAFPTKHLINAKQTLGAFAKADRSSF